MALKFYYAPMTSSEITDSVLKELQIPFERITLNFKEKEHKKPEYLAINPNGTVPTVVHDGVTIFETAAITMYLGETFGVEKGLYPPLGTKRGEAMKWIVWSMVTMGSAAMHLMACNGSAQPESLVYLAPEERTPEKHEKASKTLGAAAGVLNIGLEGRSYLLGEEYSLADTHVFSVVGWTTYMKFDVSPYENITKWMQRCTERSASRSDVS